MNRKYLIQILLITTSILFLLNACTFDENDAGGDPGNGDPNSTVPNTPGPVDGAINVNNALTLSWKSAGAVSYDVRFDTNNPPIKLEENDTPNNSTVVIAPGLGTTYYWQVTANLPGGLTSAGPVWSFITQTTGAVSPGYTMIMYDLSVEPPSNVKVLFQVLDLADNGVDYLTVNDFEIYENGELISNLESNLQITKSDDNDFVFQTLLMLDNSTSITDNPALPNGLIELQDAAKYFVNNMSPIQEFAVYEFSGDANQLIDFTDFGDKGKITNAINSITIGSPSTDLYGATIAGADRLTEKITGTQIIQSAMILFTDGDDTQDSHTLSQALNSIHQKSVYTVGLGTTIDPDILDALGNEGSYKISDISQLLQQFAIIQDDIVLLANSFYWMEYVSPKRGNFEHTFLLRIKNNPVNSTIEDTFTSAGFVDPIPGIYFNTSFIFPYGKTDYNLISGGDEIEIEVTSIGGAFDPNFSWTFPPELDWKLNADKSVATISAVPNILNEVSVMVNVKDLANIGVSNTFSDDINFVIYPN